MFKTVYKHVPKRRPEEWRWCIYKTKSLTKHHQAIRDMYPNSATYENCGMIITNFIDGIHMPLPKPIIHNGKLIARGDEWLSE